MFIFIYVTNYTLFGSLRLAAVHRLSTTLDIKFKIIRHCV